MSELIWLTRCPPGLRAVATYWPLFVHRTARCKWRFRAYSKSSDFRPSGCVVGSISRSQACLCQRSAISLNAAAALGVPHASARWSYSNAFSRHSSDVSTALRSHLVLPSQRVHPITWLQAQCSLASLRSQLSACVFSIRLHCSDIWRRR